MPTQAALQNVFFSTLESPPSGVGNPRSVQVHFKIAATSAEAQSIFRLRYDVLVETDRYYPANESRQIHDEFDTLKTTHLLMAMVDDALVGTLRLVLDGPFGIPSDDYFSVGTLLNRGNLLGDLSRIAVRREYRNAGLAFELMRLGQTIGLDLGVSQFVGVSNPKAFSLFERLGWEAIGPMNHSAKYGVPFIPIKGEGHRVHTLHKASDQTLDQRQPLAVPAGYPVYS